MVEEVQATSAQFPGSPGYYSRPGPGALLTEAQKTAINGHANTSYCNAWISAFGNFDNPRVNNCGAGFPAALLYNPTTNKQGLRCNNVEHVQSLVGRFVDTDGVLKTKAPYDNVGVQYGLKALQTGVISAEEFVKDGETIAFQRVHLARSGAARSALRIAVAPEPRAPKKKAKGKCGWWFRKKKSGATKSARPRRKRSARA